LEGFGTAASQLLEAELVTADGRIRIVNPRRDPDLFWAPKGGGGGTFGVVTRVTLRTHDLPTSFGSITATEFSTTIGCASDRSRSRTPRFVVLASPTVTDEATRPRVDAELTRLDGVTHQVTKVRP
jgi:FAD/FMN-containing dehydrogenase